VSETKFATSWTWLARHRWYLFIFLEGFLKKPPVKPELRLRVIKMEMVLEARWEVWEQAD
jgi:hypothetical protein